LLRADTRSSPARHFDHAGQKNFLLVATTGIATRSDPEIWLNGTYLLISVLDRTQAGRGSIVGRIGPAELSLSWRS
jgi:hypothetical protein